jgi:polysaccharide export outer membrane protein
VAAISATAGLQPDVRSMAPPVAIAKAAITKVVVAPAPVVVAPKVEKKVLVAQAPAQPIRPKASEPAPSAAPTTPIEQPARPLYRLGAKDVLQISVFDEPRVSGSYQVNGDGDLELPLVGKIHVLSLTIPDLQAEIVHQFVAKQILLQPTVNVQLLRTATGSISVVGDVKLPGQFTIGSPISLYEALAKAGWTTVDAGPNVLLSKSASDTPRIISLDDLQKSNDPSLNVMLTGGEIINVPDAPKVWVTGNVTHPIGVLINKLEDATVLKVIGRAQGLTENYVKTAYIYRANDNGTRREIPIPLKDIMHRKAQDVPLQAGDILLIPSTDGNPHPEYYDTKPPLQKLLLESPR